MKYKVTASIVRDGDWYVAQCLEIDVASQGKTAEEALANLREAVELHFEPPTPTVVPDLRQIEVEIDAA
jgi:predicted RNase H-like HicB family nuclease